MAAPTTTRCRRVSPRRMSGGLAFTVAYTWSQALGDYLDHLSAGGGAVGNFPLTAYDMGRDYGPLAFDIPHRFVTSFIYELPWGKGRRSQPTGVAGRDRQRLGSQRHSLAQLGTAVHDYGNRSRGHRTGTHRARQLHRRSDAGRIRSDQRRLVRHQRVHADRCVCLRQLRLQHGARTGLEVDESLAVPFDSDRRRAARRVPARNVQSVQLGQLRIPRARTCRTSTRSAASRARWAIRERFSWR